MFPSKQTTRAAAEERYGEIDLASRYWEDWGKWIKLMAIADVFPNWKVLNTALKVKRIACNTDMAPALAAALHEIDEGGMGHLLKTFDGCFNIRMVRGSHSLVSAHSYGLAVDLNAEDNKLGATKGGLFDQPNLVACFTRQGFDWGGDFRSRKDPMHFSYCWE